MVVRVCRDFDFSCIVIIDIKEQKESLACDAGCSLQGLCTYGLLINRIFIRFFMQSV